MHGECAWHRRLLPAERLVPSPAWRHWARPGANSLLRLIERSVEQRPAYRAPPVEVIDRVTLAARVGPASGQRPIVVSQLLRRKQASGAHYVISAVCQSRACKSTERLASRHDAQHATVVDGKPPKVMRQTLRSSAAASTISSGISGARKSCSV